MSFNSGPMVNGHGSGQGHLMRDEPPATKLPDLVAEAHAALRAFRVEDYDTAKLLLRMWRRRIELTDAQVEDILSVYPPVDLDPIFRSGTGGGINS